MKKLTIVIFIVILTACGNKKAKIVEELKKTKNKLIETQMIGKSYSYAASKLMAYNVSLSDYKKYGGQQMKDNAQMYKKSYENAIQDLKGVSPEILKSQKKLDSIAFVYKRMTWGLAHRLDSLQLELKKY